ncbi:hypothetical protein LHYA1_G000367 [Lachnellula hyalina]|uniref:Uncharacterized protein n=1 Tax=Lachnellula hyalina TaxID=1316788 RepID=A0A8H8RA51_9HELO|nr:uncharacterized protein LHYA1_G000367 [Lachnellula hyalina]TVY30784.1 hypothetical protein LHYA1_G000367 [Lachnellula hyalina]
MANILFDDLTKILCDRDIPFDRDAIRSALNDPESQTAIREWMEEYLAPETLLTKDEAALYATLSKSGEAERLAAQDLSSIQGLNDTEIQDAIEELKRSTAAIEKQSEALKSQQNAMSALVKNEKRTRQSRTQTSNSQLKKWNAQKGHVSKAIEELSQSLAYQSADLEQQRKASEASVKQTVDDILRSDDKLLASLQKLASDLDPIQSDNDMAISRIKDLCARLIKHTVEGIRTKLDRIYLHALQNSATSQEPDSQETTDLQEELESLYSEILPVAQMSAEQQFLQPALKAIAATDGQGQERAAIAVKYIHDCVLFLVNRIETFLERAEESQCHKMAIQCVLDAAKKELSRVEDSPATSSPNTQRRRTSSAARSPVRTRNNTRRRSSVLENDDVEPEQQIARNLGITLPPVGVSEQARANALEKSLSERLTKLEIHSTSLQSTTESSISAHFLDANLTLQLLQDSLLAESLYSKVRLLDPDIEASVTMFEQEIESLQGGLEGIDLSALQERNVKREQLVERWSR